MTYCVQDFNQKICLKRKKFLPVDFLIKIPLLMFGTKNK